MIGVAPRVQDLQGQQAAGLVDGVGEDPVMGRLGEPILYSGREAFTAQARRDNAEKVEVVRSLGLTPR